MKRVLTALELGLFMIFASCAITMNKNGEELAYFLINQDESSLEKYVFDIMDSDEDGQVFAETLDAVTECPEEVKVGDNINIDTVVKYENKSELTAFVKISDEYCKKRYELVVSNSMTLIKTNDFGIVDFIFDETSKKLTLNVHHLRGGIFDSKAVPYFYDLVDIELKPGFPAEFSQALINKKLFSVNANDELVLDTPRECRSQLDIKDTAPYLINCPVTDSFFCPIALAEPAQIIIVKNADDSICYLRFEITNNSEVLLKNFQKGGLDKVVKIKTIGSLLLDLEDPFAK